MKPPKYATKILLLFSDPDWQDEILGDLHEKFIDISSTHGLRRASFLYWMEVFKLLRPHLFKKHQKSNITFMTLNHIKISYRNLLRNKVYAFINIFGLAVGLASVILIGIYINFETSYDKFFKDNERIYRVPLHRVYPTMTKDFGTSSIMVAPTLKANYPQVEEATRLMRLFFQNEINVTVSDSTEGWEKNFVETKFLFADSLFFNVFSHEFLYGDPKSALDLPESVVISRTTAIKYFGEENVVGKTIEAGSPLIISGVVRDVPDNSHIHFDLLGSLSSLNFLNNAISSNNWTNPWVYTYIKLKSERDAKEVGSQLDQMVNTYGSASISQSNGQDWKSNGHAYEYYLQPLSSIHLESQLDVEVEPNSNIVYIYVLAVIALFILFISSINFINLSIARSTERAKEVGIRKVMGSYKSHLINQFLVEALFVCTISGIIAFILLYVSIPTFNDLLGTHLSFSAFASPITVVGVVGAVLITGLLSGLYPAFMISSMKPTQVLKGSFKTSEKGIWLRNVLITFQFLISIVMISGSVIASQQMTFLQTKDLGFKKDDVLLVKQTFNLATNFDAFKNSLSQIPGIEQVGNATVVPGMFHGSNVFSINHPDIPDVRVNTATIDDDYLDAMKFELIEGRGFNPEFNDSLSIVINEAARDAMGVESALGYKFGGGGNSPETSPEFTVVGVVKDFNYYSLHSQVSPYVMFNMSDGSNGNIAVVRLSGQNSQNILASIEDTWNENSEEEFSFSFLDQDLQRQYEADQKTTILFDIFTYIAIIMSCTGLFGLATYIVNQRSKEMSIRKVLGASIGHILTVFSKDFVILIGVAFVIGVPLAYFSLSRWLENFAYHVNIGVLAFLLAGVVTTLLVVITVSYQVLKIASVNPVRLLRSE